MYNVGDYSLRPIEGKDLRMILEWRNSEEIHSLMLTDHKITYEEHYQWFQRMRDNPVKRNLVFEYMGRPVGYVGYTEFDPQARTCSPGAYLGDRRGLPVDAGIYLFYMTIDYAFEKLNMIRLNTDVFARNERAIRLDTFLGYRVVEDGDHYVEKAGKRELAKRLELTVEEWRQYGKHLLS